MRTNGNGIDSIRPPRHARFGLTCVTALAVLVAGCSAVPPTPDGPPAAPVEPTSGEEGIPNARRGEFTISAGMLDTWNAVGQILVRTDGVIYEGRAQMLGIYAVKYRGEHFLIVTQARVPQDSADGLVTEVSAVHQNGAPNGSAATVELLGLLQQRLPAELARIAAGERG